MAKDDELLDDQISEDDLLDFDLDDLTTEDIHQDLVGEGSDDDEIIELVDLVEKGEEEGLGKSIENSSLPSEDQATQSFGDLDALAEDISGLEGVSLEEEPGQSDDELDLSDLSLDSSIDLGEVQDGLTETEEFTESDVEKALGEQVQDMDSSLNSLDGDDDSLEDLLSEEGLEESKDDFMSESAEEIEDTDTDIELGDMLEDSDLDLGETVQTPIPDTVAGELFSEEVIAEPDISDEAEVVTESVDDVPEAPYEADVVTPSEEVEVPVGLSEEKIESIISGTVAEIVERVARETISDVVERVAREVVAEVTERVTRETVADVAEKVITEAIDALKQSLESEAE